MLLFDSFIDKIDHFCIAVLFELLNYGEVVSHNLFIAVGFADRATHLRRAEVTSDLAVHNSTGRWKLCRHMRRDDVTHLTGSRTQGRRPDCARARAPTPQPPPVNEKLDRTPGVGAPTLPLFGCIHTPTIILFCIHFRLPAHSASFVPLRRLAPPPNLVEIIAASDGGMHLAIPASA